VVDYLTNYGHGLNLTYEVRDGIISHCGETFEQEIQPDRSKNLAQLNRVKVRNTLPATLEGCLVRMADKVAYLGRDLEDAFDAKMVSRQELPSEIKEGLGDSNGKIIGQLVHDIVLNSLDYDGIRLSRGVFERMKKLRDFNYNKIYNRQNYAERIEHIISNLFNEYIDILIRTHGGKEKRESEKLVRLSPMLSVFFDFIKNKGIPESMILTPEDCGKAVFALCSGFMDAMNGQVISVDLGMPFRDNSMMDYISSKK